MPKRMEQVLGEIYEKAMKDEQCRESGFIPIKSQRSLEINDAVWLQMDSDELPPASYPAGELGIILELNVPHEGLAKVLIKGRFWTWPMSRCRLATTAEKRWKIEEERASFPLSKEKFMREKYERSSAVEEVARVFSASSCECEVLYDGGHRFHLSMQMPALDCNSMHDLFDKINYTARTSLPWSPSCGVTGVSADRSLHDPNFYDVRLIIYIAPDATRLLPDREVYKGLEEFEQAAERTAVLKKEIEDAKIDYDIAHLKEKIRIGLGVPKQLRVSNPRPGVEIDKHGNPHKPGNIVPQKIPDPFKLEDIAESDAKCREADCVLSIGKFETSIQHPTQTTGTYTMTFKRHPTGRDELFDPGDYCPSCRFCSVPPLLPTKTVVLIKEGKIDCPMCGWKHGRCRAGLQQGRKPCNELLVSSYVSHAGQKERYHCPKCSQTYDEHFNML